MAEVRRYEVGSGTVMVEVQMQIEFGVKLSGYAGAVIARTSADGHFILRMTWSGSPVSPLEEE